MPNHLILHPRRADDPRQRRAGEDNVWIPKEKKFFLDISDGGEQQESMVNLLG
jgi:hypothetical protein